VLDAVGSGEGVVEVWGLARTGETVLSEADIDEEVDTTEDVDGGSGRT
jgi:hypothetical protein